MKIVIIGAGDCAMMAADILVEDRNFKLSGFVGIEEEEAKFANKKLYGDVPFIGNHRILKRLRDDNIVGFIAAIKNNSFREKAYYDATQAGLTPINAISRNAVINHLAVINRGIIVSPGCIILHNVSIGENSILEPGVTVGIDSKVGENCFLSSSCVVSGECDVGRNTTLGVKAAILPYAKVGKNQNIEAGRIVKESLPDIIREEFEI